MFYFRLILSLLVCKISFANMNPAILTVANKKTYHFQLENGLNVFLTENSKAPTTSIYHWVKAGSLHEKTGVTGIAHLFEHMMFRPVGKNKNGFMDRIKELGGSANANTRFYATVYTTSVPNDKIEKALILESERFQKLNVTKELLDIERKAVWSEYSTKFDVNPTLELWALIYRQTFPAHPYGWTVIGEREDLEKITSKDCNNFFKKYYGPQNVGLFISGDFKATELFKTISSLYKSWKKTDLANLPKDSIDYKSNFIAEGKINSQSRNALIGFVMPTQPVDIINYKFLNYILTSSKHSIFDQDLKHDKKLVSLSNDFNFEYDSGMMKFYFVLKPDTKIDELKKYFFQLHEKISKIADDEIEAYNQELRTDIQMSLLRNEDRNDWQAMAWGKYNDITIIDQLLNAKINKNSLSKLAQSLFTEKNIAIAISKGGLK